LKSTEEKAYEITSLSVCVRIVTQRLSKHVLAAKNAHGTGEEMLGALLYMFPFIYFIAVILISATHK
jgi:hypothetical protein